MQVQNGLAGAVARAYSRQVGGIDTSATRTTKPATAGAPRVDSIGLSNAAQEVARLRGAVETAPDVRADRIAALKASIAGGGYAVDSSALAAAMLGGAA